MAAIGMPAALASTTAPQVATPASIDLARICAVVVAETADASEQRAAKILGEALRTRYGATARVTDRADCVPAVLLGRSAAVGAAFAESGELDDLGPDGYLLRIREGRLVAAGGQPAGTVFAAYALLRKVGIRYYPWRNGGGVETFEPVPDGQLNFADESDRPFFDYRDVLTHLDGGRYGASLRQHALGDLAFANDDPEFKSGGWVNWDHTAGWLVPRGRYAAAHPEYFAESSSRLAPPPTAQVALCACATDVTAIAAARARDWVQRQPGRRYFAVTDGDVDRPRCPACEAHDPLPDYATDRLLGWVNGVAEAIADASPGKQALTLAYLSTVKPPRRVAPAANVTVAYAPWYWTSRGSSAVGFAHPLNMVAGREIDDWVRAFPGQVGLYDYPGNWVSGTAERIRFVARYGGRWVYLNGPQGDLLQWVSARLLWDPFQEIGDLVEEFTSAYYGPAAAPMREYLQLEHAVVAQRSRESRDVFADPEFVRRSPALMRRAGELAAGANAAVQARVLEGEVQALFSVLRGARPEVAPAALARAVAERYLAANERLFELYAALPGGQAGVTAHLRDLSAQLTELGYSPGKAAGERPDALLRASRDLPERIVAPWAAVPARAPVRRVSFEGPGEVSRWRVRGTLPAAAASPTLSATSLATGDRRPALTLRAALTQLPTGRRGGEIQHFGRVHARRVLDAPLPVTAGQSVLIGLVASADLPLTVYLTVGGQRLKSDLALHTGEQWIRVELANFTRGGSLALADGGSLGEIGFDLWPQDNVYPYPPADDVSLSVLGLEVRDGPPLAGELPYRQRVIWLAQFAANVSHGDGAVGRVAAAAGAGSPRAVLGILGDYGSATGEAFRSFTEYRRLSPLAGIAVAATSSPAARRLQAALATRFGVELPLLPAERARDGNVIVVGAAAARLSGVAAADWRDLGPDGAWVRAEHGRVIVAGESADADLAAVERLLALEGIGEVPALGAGGGYLHEWYLRDVAWFGGSLPDCSGAPGRGLRATTGAEITRQIRTAARRGEHVLPPSVVALARESADACRWARRLARDPFAVMGSSSGAHAMEGAAP
jgi:hypothetical protein